VLASQSFIDRLANQIEHAFALHPESRWHGYSSRGLWTAAARRLWQVHLDNPELPLDANLFVAAQRFGKASQNPWSQLTEQESVDRYRSQVKRIVKLLRTELKGEIRFVERSILRGSDLESLLMTDHPRLSPLGRFIAAHRFERQDLAAHFAEPATLQHHACPLYRAASRSLLPADLYPVQDFTPAHIADAAIRDAPPSAIDIHHSQLLAQTSHHLDN
jgi:hypothetical protein